MTLIYLRAIPGNVLVHSITAASRVYAEAVCMDKRSTLIVPVAGLLDIHEGRHTTPATAGWSNKRKKSSYRFKSFSCLTASNMTRGNDFFSMTGYSSADRTASSSENLPQASHSPEWGHAINHKLERETLDSYQCHQQNTINGRSMLEDAKSPQSNEGATASRVGGKRS